MFGLVDLHFFKCWVQHKDERKEVKEKSQIESKMRN